MTQTSDVLASKRLPELQAMAAAMGIKGISKMRKGDLIAAMGGGAPSSRTDAGTRPAEDGAVRDDRPDDRSGADRPDEQARSDDRSGDDGRDRTEDRDTEITVSAFLAQLEALRVWGKKAPADLSVVKQPVLVVNGDQDRMVPTVNTHDLARRLPNSQLIIYPDAGHGGAFQFHADFVRSTLGFLAR